MWSVSCGQVMVCECEGVFGCEVNRVEDFSFSWHCVVGFRGEANDCRLGDKGFFFEKREGQGLMRGSITEKKGWLKSGSRWVVKWRRGLLG